MNIYDVSAFVPGVGHIGVRIGAHSASAAASAVRAQYPGAQVNTVTKVSGA